MAGSPPKWLKTLCVGHIRPKWPMGILTHPLTFLHADAYSLRKYPQGSGVDKVRGGGQDLQCMHGWPVDLGQGWESAMQAQTSRTPPTGNL